MRRALPQRGRLHVDRQLPFLCVYRRPDDGDVGTERLVTGEAAYLVAPGSASFREDVGSLVTAMVQTLSPQFGGYLIIEIWAAPDGGKANDPAVPGVSPKFIIHAPSADPVTRTIEVLERNLKQIKVMKQGVEVETRFDDQMHPLGSPPLLEEPSASWPSWSLLGLEIPPVYRKLKGDRQYPLILRQLRRSVGLALRKAFFEFTESCTTQRPPHYHALGRRAVVKAVWNVDRKLAGVSRQFDYLLQLSPMNSQAIWRRFRKSQFERLPEFHYRPLPVDPAILKRELYAIPIERVEDPALQSLFHDKQAELELKLTMLRDRDTPRFVYQSIELFGRVRDDLLAAAEALLSALPREAVGAKGPRVDAGEFAQRAEQEFEFYLQDNPDFVVKTRIGSDLNGLMASKGRLLIGSDLSLRPSRVDALLAHEVGTHLLTYFNGRAQPFQQLYAGLAGYEELQEGLAVLSEYLVGGLNRARIRTLAARVVAVRCVTDGASFVETFRKLRNELGFASRTAFGIALRVYRGGGLTKDMIYLRGLRALLRYLQRGGDLDILWVGKMAARHVPIIRELQHRGVLKPAPSVPRFMQDPQAIDRLEALRNGNGSVLDLVSDDGPNNAR